MSLLRSLCGITVLACGALASAQTHRGPAPPAHGAVEPTGPTVVIDSSGGRFACRLYSGQAPITSANFIALANGTRDWTDGVGAVQHGKPFYDGLQVFGTVDGIAGGDRTSVGLGSAGPAVAPEKTGLNFDRAGRLAALLTNGQQSASGFAIVEHADLEWAKRGVVFGQCDQPSTALAASLSHELLSTDNRPEKPVVLRRVAIVQEGQPLPAPAEPIPGEADLRVPPLPPPAVPAPEATGPTATIETSLGTISCRLFKETPVAMANFVGLATGAKPFRSPATHASVSGKHFYDGLTFRRVIPDFMIQNADMPGDPEGGGDIGIHFANEVVPGLTFDRPGRLAYANAGPNTNASEFFITEHPAHRLDGNFTIFGQCDEASVKIVEAIARVPRDEHNKPLTAVTIRHITMQPAE
jgi:cyclophilin family peptidyl-prolyl cis-trans isomerase